MSTWSTRRALRAARPPVPESFRSFRLKDWLDPELDVPRPAGWPRAERAMWSGTRAFRRYQFARAAGDPTEQREIVLHELRQFLRWTSPPTDAAVALTLGAPVELVSDCREYLESHPDPAA